eukprot:scaffold69969_cov20-Tisochrysis_lutea.AAC.1
MKEMEVLLTGKAEHVGTNVLTCLRELVADMSVVAAVLLRGGVTDRGRCKNEDLPDGTHLQAPVCKHLPTVCLPLADLEFDPRVNPEVDGDGLVDLLVLECVALMK